MRSALFLEDSEIIQNQVELLNKRREAIVVGIPLTNRERDSVFFMNKQGIRPIYVIPWTNNIKFELLKTLKWVRPEFIVFKIAVWGPKEYIFDPKGIQPTALDRDSIKDIEKFLKENNVEGVLHIVRTPWLPPNNYYDIVKQLTKVTTCKVSLDVSEFICDVKNWEGFRYDAIYDLKDFIQVTWLSSIRYDNAKTYVSCACTDIINEVWEVYKKFFKHAFPIIKSDRLSKDNQIIDHLNYIKNL